MPKTYFYELVSKIVDIFFANRIGPIRAETLWFFNSLFSAGDPWPPRRHMCVQPLPRPLENRIISLYWIGVGGGGWVGR